MKWLIVGRLNGEVVRASIDADTLDTAISGARRKGVEIAGIGPLNDSHLTKVAAEMQQAGASLATLKAEAEDLRKQIVGLADEYAMEEVGIYRRRFDFEDPQTFKNAVEANVDRQKQMVRDGTACSCSTKWQVEGSEAKGKKMVQEQIKLMLRAFNGESDAAICSAKASNFPALHKRISKAFEAINKLGATKQISISSAYLQLRLDELQLCYELELKKEEIKRAQREARKQIEEEARVERELEEAERKAEKEEQEKERSLAIARQQLADEHGKHNERLQQLVLKLEAELSEAIDRKAKAIARAQLTKSGHVYVLSNIGAFGRDFYKIGMTRRLEPLIRIDELGDASVPFPFDVHAMIYSENAPALECALHTHFADRRVNLVNLRKEYFRVTMDEIRQAVEQYFGQITILIEPPATEYRESLAKRSAPPALPAIAPACLSVLSEAT